MKSSFLFTLIIFAPTMLDSMDKPHQDHQQLFDYAANNQWDNFQQSLLSYNGLLNKTNAAGYTFVHLAVLGNQEECVATLITKKAPLMCCDIIRKPIVATPLHYAAYKGYTKIAQMLIDTDKVDLDSTNAMYSNTPLHLAAWSNHPEIVGMLIKAGALINTFNSMGSMPVHSAAWKNSSESLEILITRGGSATQSNTRGIGNTPLYLAAKAGSNNCLQFLINYLQVKLEPYAFINHLDQECADGNSTAIQAAGGRKNLQCYWNLALVDGDYRAKIKPENKSYLSEEIIENDPVKKFLETIEKQGKNNPPAYQGADSACSTCNVGYKKNDVVVDLVSCNHSFHVSCFKNHALENTIKEYQDTPGMQNYLKQDKSPQDIKHDILNNPWIPIDWEMVKKCPHCLNPASFNAVGRIAVFLTSLFR